MEQSKKKTKSSDPWARSGERPGWGHGSELFVFFFCFFFFLFFHCFLQFGQNLEKTKKKQKKSSDPWARSGRGLAGDMGLNFLFLFLVFPLFFLQFGQNLEKTKKNKKNKKFRPMGKVSERPGWGHGSELFVFFCFQLFFHCCLHVFHVKMLSSQYLSKNARF